MSRRIFRTLLSVEDAMNRFSRHYAARPKGVEVVPLSEASGRVLARHIEAGIDVPPFDRATMDGFAVQAADTYPAEEDRAVTLRVIGGIGAGDQPDLSLTPGAAVEISTGAPIPSGANAVVMVEYTWREDASVHVYRPVTPGENVMGAGSDIMAGELVLRSGDLITPRETGLLSALGVTDVEVYRKPRVAVLSTGNEIVEPGSLLRYGQIYDINVRTISDSVAEHGGIVEFLGIVRDDPDELRIKLREAVRGHDLVIASGGTSAGVGDLLHRVINDLGEPGILVHGVSMKPGKPLIIALVDDTPFFGLPGYPTSALMSFSLFVKPTLRQMAGLPAHHEGRTVPAKVAQRIHAAGGRREYKPVNLVQTATGDYAVYPVPSGSGAITTLAEADGYLVIPEHRTFLDADEAVQVQLLSPWIQPADLTIIGSHCVGIDALLLLLRDAGSRVKSKVLNTGSSGGFSAIRRGEADVAGVHLLDDATGTYNTPFLERFEVADLVVLIRGYRRQQGFIVLKGNPKKVRGFTDLTRRKLRFINRNAGSGTRILLDYHLRRIATSTHTTVGDLTSRIDGYRLEAKSHTAVAVAVLHGKADVGLGIRPVAERYGLAFLPVADEQFDFLVRTDRLHKPVVKAFLEVLRSDRFKSALRRLPGIDPLAETGVRLHPRDP